ncbi:MAG: ring-cleaving dioxygenase [Geminicoccaceae bacterium]|nr:ring-cleaving dioxygenase [Geminicoccaceae bacterium]MDW8123423.1 ring-cleaving dioxygenase [Geminicoccaceae bacterium]
MPPVIGGLHHVTAISADGARNRWFYNQVLGLRLVKKTVNQDDVFSWHLFYADAVGSPGTDITFFVWDLPAERRGNHSIALTSFRVESEADLAWWDERLRAHGIAARRSREPGGRPGLRFQDLEGQRLALVLDDGPSSAVPWASGPVPAERQLRGLGPVTLAVPEAEPTARFLVELLGFRALGEEDERTDPGGARIARFAVGPGGAGAEVHLRIREGLPRARPGAGGAHHLALRVPDRAGLAAWSARLSAAGLRHSGEVDRFWFRSLYVREPNGILFELATDGPGFTIDEAESELGERLVLPPFLEPRRAEIEAALPPLRLRPLDAASPRA